MDKNAQNTIDDLNRKIESLQQKRDAVIRREKEKKAKAQDKWKSIFLKELMKGIVRIYGDSFEEAAGAEDLAGDLCHLLENNGEKDLGKDTVKMDECAPVDAAGGGDISPVRHQVGG